MHTVFCLGVISLYMFYLYIAFFLHTWADRLLTCSLSDVLTVLLVSSSEQNKLGFQGVFIANFCNLHVSMNFFLMWIVIFLNPYINSYIIFMSMNFDNLKLAQIKVFIKHKHVKCTHVDYSDRLIDSPSWMIKSEGILFVRLLMVIQFPLRI